MLLLLLAIILSQLESDEVRGFADLIDSNRARIPSWSSSFTLELDDLNQNMQSIGRVKYNGDIKWDDKRIRYVVRDASGSVVFATIRSDKIFVQGKYITDTFLVTINNPTSIPDEVFSERRFGLSDPLIHFGGGAARFLRNAATSKVSKPASPIGERHFEFVNAGNIKATIICSESFGLMPISVLLDPTAVRRSNRVMKWFFEWAKYGGTIGPSKVETIYPRLCTDQKSIQEIRDVITFSDVVIGSKLSDELFKAESLPFPNGVKGRDHRVYPSRRISYKNGRFLSDEELKSQVSRTESKKQLEVLTSNANYSIVGVEERQSKETELSPAHRKAISGRFWSLFPYYVGLACILLIALFVLWWWKRPKHD